MHELYHRYARRVSSVIIVLLFGIGLWQLAAAGWIQGKSIIAQQLLNTSWNKTLSEKTSADHGSTAHKPWPWADTWPVARLTVPKRQVEQIILAGDSGSSLAFAPGYSLAGVEPNSAGTTVISGHRDTHFRFLKDIQLGDMLHLQTIDGTERYQVVDLQIVDSKNYKVQSSADGKTLVLATCYPFDAMTSGGTLRYLVFANKHPDKY